jgi:hypothetical protein
MVQNDAKIEHNFTFFLQQKCAFNPWEPDPNPDPIFFGNSGSKSGSATLFEIQT